MSRTHFYEYKRRFQTHGIEGLKDLPPIHHHHPFTTLPKVVERILALSLEHPAWGCNRLHDWLKLEGVSVSAITIQRILNQNEMRSRHHLWLKLEAKFYEKANELTPEQVLFMEKQSPVFREWHVESSRSGKLLSQDTFYVGYLKEIGRVYLHAVVDTYSSYGFGFLHTSKQPEAAVAVLHNDVLPFYQDRSLTVTSILTDNGPEFCGKDTYPYEIYLELNDIEHRRTKVRKPRNNGFVERFNRTVLEVFFN